ncbi:MAG TPA: hypothetical protein PK668_20965 [Myxococcota bacterium]|nr:hypothetical protein [Myxococcota bacterium]HRY96616.1 hypothetical protein [Myxococcota bacterium]HSA21411.1 hypothetical protein [Myxococcota bacterium]
MKQANETIRGEVVARFFSQAQPDWASADGREVQEALFAFLWSLELVRLPGCGQADRENLAMEAWHKLFDHVRAGKPVRARSAGELRALCRITLKNLWRDGLRDEKRFHHKPVEGLGQPVDDDEGEGGLARTPAALRVEPEAEEAVDRRRDVERVRAGVEAVGEKNPRLRRVLELELAEASTEELMAALGVSSANAHQLRTRARKALREAFA